MARILFLFVVCLFPAAKACDCAKIYGLECKNKDSCGGLEPILNPKCMCCGTCPKKEYEECGGPYYSKGQCNAAEVELEDGKVPKLYCSRWDSYEAINKHDEDAILNGSNITGTCLRKVCVKTCSEHTPTSGRVCGSDGIEYKSKCHLKQKNNCYIEDQANKVKTVNKSKCPCFGIRCGGIGEVCSEGECVCMEEGECENVDEPVWGSNGVLYRSKCHANAAICKAPREEKFTISNRTCEELDRCKNQCTGQGQICEFQSGQYVCVCESLDNCVSNDEVCGSNGYTYTSVCNMDVYACNRNQTVTIDHTGPCSSDTSSGLSTPPNHIYE